MKDYYEQIEKIAEALFIETVLAEKDIQRSLKLQIILGNIHQAAEKQLVQKIGDSVRSGEIKLWKLVYAIVFNRKGFNQMPENLLEDCFKVMESYLKEYTNGPTKSIWETRIEASKSIPAGDLAINALVDCMFSYLVEKYK